MTDTTRPEPDSTMPEPDTRHGPLEELHRSLGAKLGPFGGWLMPIEYRGVLSEHRAVRERVGLFDLSHLGKVDVVGAAAFGALQGLLTNDLGRVDVGGAQYHHLLNERGGVEGQDAGPHAINLRFRQEHPPGAECPREGWDHDAPRAKLVEERAGVRRPTAADGDEIDVARVVAAPHRNQLQRIDRLLVGDADHARRGPLD